MVIVLQILGIVALISFIYLAFVAIGVIKQIKQTVEITNSKINVLTNDFQEIKIKSFQTMNSIIEFQENVSVALNGINEVKSKVITSLDGFDSMTNEISGTVEAIHTTGKNVADFLRPFEAVIGSIFPRLSTTAKLVSAFTKGIGVFSRKIKD